MKLMCEQHPFSYESRMHFLLYENHIISYDTRVITSYASHMTAFLYKSFHVKFIFILYDNYVWRNWLCRLDRLGRKVRQRVHCLDATYVQCILLKNDATADLGPKKIFLTADTFAEWKIL